MAVKIPPLLHKMSLTAQKAWYKKHGMEMPAAEKSSETKERSAAVAKRVKVEPRKTIAVEPGSVRALNAARQQAYMAKGGRQPIGAMGSGGSNVMAGAGQSTIKDLKASIKAGFNPKVSLNPYQGEKETKKKKVEEASKPDASMAMTQQLKMKMISDKDKRTLGKVAALMAAQKNKDKKNEYVRQLGLKAMKAGQVDPARGHSPTRFGREALKKEEVESVEEGVATAQKVMDRASVVAKTNPDPKKRFAASSLARKAMLRTINPTGVNTGIVRGGGNKTYRMLGKVPPYQLTPKTGVSEEVEQIDEIKISDVINATRGKSPEEKQKIIQQMRDKENASKPKTAPRKLEPPKDIPMHQRVYPDDMKYHGDSVELEGPVMNEVTKKEAETALGGPVKEKPKMPPGKQPAGYRYARNLARKAMKAGLKKEEVELTEAPKDEREYGYEGDMAMSQLKSIIMNAQKLHDMLKPDTDLPEWVQLKITLAEDYVVTAANYCATEMSEEVEQVDEKIDLVKAKMGDVIKDFQKSDAPQFKGKSQEERRKMALAAKLSAEREAGVREEIETTEEPIEEKYMGFAKLKASIAAKGGARDPAAVAAAIGRKKYGKEKFQAMAAAGKRKANEEVEQIDETYQSKYSGYPLARTKYVTKAELKAREKDKTLRTTSNYKDHVARLKKVKHLKKMVDALHDNMQADFWTPKSVNKSKPIDDATHKKLLTRINSLKEEVEQIDEQSPAEIKAKYYHDQFDKVKPVKAYDKEGKLVGRYRSMDHAKQMKPGHTYKVEEEVEKMHETSIVNGKKQDPKSLVWKQTGMNYSDAVSKHGKENVKIGAKNRLGEPTVHVKVPLGEEADVVTEAEGKLAVTPKEKDLAAHHGDKTRITFGDVLKARLKSAAEKAMKKGN